MSKKICIFSAQYLPHMGGVENYTYNLGKKLIGMGYEITIVTSNVQHLKMYEVLDGMEVYRFPCSNLLEGRYPVVKFNKDFRKIYKRLKRENFDFVVVNTRFYLHSLVGVFFAQKAHIPHIVIEHGTGHLTIHNKLWDGIGQVYEHVLTKLVYHYCKDYYGVSEACNEWLAHFHIQAKGTLYNAIDLGLIDTQLAKQNTKYRAQYHIPPQSIVITFTGRLLKEKGLLSLVDAVEKINKGNQKVYLLIAGEGDLAEDIQKRKSDTVIPLGRLPFEDVICLLQESDIFCLPSDSEGFSTSILEATACSCYIITTQRGGATELIIDNTYGTILQSNGVQKVQQAIEEAIAQPRQREVAIKLARKRLTEKFTWDITAKNLESVYENIKGE